MSEQARPRLSGQSGDVLASQAIWCVYPVTRSNDEHRAVLLSWYGVTGPAPTADELLREAGRTVSWIRHLCANTAHKVREQIHPVTPAQLEVLSAPIEPGEDQQARVRRAQLFGTPRPTVAKPQGRRQHAFVDLAVRCIVALGPLTAEQLTAAIVEGRQFRKEHRGDGYEDLLDVLRRTPRLTYSADSGRFAVRDSTLPTSRNSELVAELRRLPRVFTYVDYRKAVQRLGFSAAYRVPMVVHVDVGRGRFALVDQLDGDLHHRLPKTGSVADQA